MSGTWIANRMSDLLDAAQEELAACGGQRVCWAGLAPGGVTTLDHCDCGNTGCGGQLTVRLVSAFPYTSFPFAADASEGGTCSKPLAYQVEVGVYRCYTMVDVSGQPPTVAAALSATADQTRDMIALRKAIKCSLDNALVEIGTYTPLGPDGTCVGGYWNAWLAEE